MFISKLSIDGYRNCCEKSQISFNKGLNILVGENASGKSTIIDALRLILKDQEQSYITEDAWQRLGCGNYAPTHFGLSLPEVIEIKYNEDGTVVLTINAVCDSVVCNDAVITHELTVKFQNDGSVHYVGNRILDNGIDNIPKYQYRLDKLQD